MKVRIVWILMGLVASFGGLAKATHVVSVCARGCDYARIQDAIDAADGESFIFVRAGEYRENLLINGKQGLNLIAYPGETVTLDAQGAAAAGITVLGSRNVTIQGVRVVGGLRGLEAGDTQGLLLQQNQFEANVSQGVVLVRTRARLLQNIILGTKPDGEGENGQGIVTTNAFATFTNNAVLDNAGFGILVTGGSNVLVEDNTVRGNGVLGIGVTEQAQATIQGNLVDAQRPTADGRFGRGIEVTSSSIVIVMNNWITHNHNVGLAVLFNAQVVVARNTITDTAGVGVLLGGQAEVAVAENTISGNQGSGVQVGQQAQVVVLANRITGNGGHGVRVGFAQARAETASVELKNNRFDGNQGCAVLVEQEDAIQVSGEQNRTSTTPDAGCDRAGKLPQEFFLTDG